MDSIIEYLKGIDSFKKIVLFFLTGLTCLSIWLGYKVVENLEVYYQWISVPHVIKSELPCNLVQIREKIYLISIAFPNPIAEISRVRSFTSSFWVTANEEEEIQFNDYCNSLIKAINSNQAESLLAPYLDRLTPDKTSN